MKKNNKSSKNFKFANANVAKLKPYTLITQEAWGIPNKKNVLKLDWNEGVSPPSPLVQKEIIKFLQSNEPLNWYPILNNDLLISKISEYCETKTDLIQYYPSSDNLQEIIVRAFIDSSDEVIIISPTYDNFRSTVQSIGAKINKFYLQGGNFSFDIDAFKKQFFGKSIKLVYLCNPNNPTGTEFSKEIIIDLLKSFKDTLFLIDEAYYEFTNNTVSDLVEDYKNLIITRTFSKAFCLAGYRLGYSITSPDLIYIMNKIRNPKNIPTLSQVALLAALNDITYMRKYVEEILHSKNYLIKKLQDMGLGVLYGGGNYLSIKIPVNSSSELIKLFKSNYIYVRDYSHVPRMEGYIRITIGKKQDMDKVVDVLKSFLS